MLAFVPRLCLRGGFFNPSFPLPCQQLRNSLLSLTQTSSATYPVDLSGPPRLTRSYEGAIFCSSKSFLPRQAVLSLSGAATLPICRGPD